MMVGVLADIVQICARCNEIQGWPDNGTSKTPPTIVLSTSSNAFLRVGSSLELSKVRVCVGCTKEERLVLFDVVRLR